MNEAKLSELAGLALDLARELEVVAAKLVHAAERVGALHDELDELETEAYAAAADRIFGIREGAL